jgi:SAM-dependent methyltransferase
MCSVCGFEDTYEVLEKPTRENYCCRRCHASLRYRLQASVLLELYGDTQRCLDELVGSSRLASLAIFEPGLIGELRPRLKRVHGYVNSYFWEGIEPGESLNGVRCENLEALTFSDQSFDLVVTSDIFEHVRHPWVAFAEVFRVLRPGGSHVFTVPFTWPLRAETESRVDTSGPNDIFLVEPVYHGSPVDPAGSLVYTDFGMDLPERLRELGHSTSVHFGFRHNAVIVAKRPSAPHAADAGMQ